MSTGTGNGFVTTMYTMAAPPCAVAVGNPAGQLTVVVVLGGGCVVGAAVVGVAVVGAGRVVGALELVDVEAAVVLVVESGTALVVVVVLASVVVGAVPVAGGLVSCTITVSGGAAVGAGT